MKRFPLTRAVLDVLRFYWWAILVVALGFAVAYKFVAPPPPREITLATGAENGGYHRFGQQLKTALEKKGLKVNLRPSAGTIDNLKSLADPQSGISMAFGQGGAERFYDGETEGIRALGSLFYEPLWLFYRRERGMASFADLKKMKVAIGKNGSGTQMLSKVLLRENNIPESCWVQIGSTEAIQALQEDQVQALFLVAPVNDPMDKQKPHPDVYRLMADGRFSLFSARRAQAYVSRLPHLSIVNIGEGLLDLEKNLPSSPLTLVSPLATLLCREDLNGDIAVLVLQTCREIQEQGGWLEKSGEFPSKLGVTFPLLPEARQFFEKGPSFLYKVLPFWVANTVNRLWIMAIPLITLFIPLVKLALPTYKWRMRRRIATRYRLLMSIDHRLIHGSTGPSLEADIAELAHYEAELAKLSVPVMFAGDYYALRMHTRYLRERLERIRDGYEEARGTSAISIPHQ